MTDKHGRIKCPECGKDAPSVGSCPHCGCYTDCSTGDSEGHVTERILSGEIDMPVSDYMDYLKKKWSPESVGIE